ncbi:terpene synthase family protein [Streptomyces sp. ET3-23]|uniref:terpene synthase family protein n=1 Tax=Streptomyces sp. ET3-23 TaxID=2885643 RepID=UPI001D10216B|nr:terpene synthase family protein [Streptomyces sp. ET3-23]MCC2280861.1 terpene synthase family protein [Streptomyces sp. ET3-23]
MLSETSSAPNHQLWCPIDVQRAPKEERRQAHQASIIWAEAVGLATPGPELSWYSQWNAAEFAARVFTRCTGEDFALATQWFGWMNVLDDRLETTSLEGLPSQLAPLDMIFESDGAHSNGAHLSATPLSKALADLWARTQPRMSSAWRARMAYLWQQCSQGFLWEARNRLTGHPPRLADYMTRRVAAGGAEFCLALTEGLYKEELDDETYYSGPLANLRTSACEHICWANDLLTLEREEARGDLHNLVLVIQAAHGLSRAEAVSTVARMTNHRMHAVITTSGMVPAYLDVVGLDPPVRHRFARAVDMTEQWLAGSLEFHQLSTRHIDHRNTTFNPFNTPT